MMMKQVVVAALLLLLLLQLLATTRAAPSHSETRSETHSTPQRPGGAGESSPDAVSTDSIDSEPILGRHHFRLPLFDPGSIGQLDPPTQFRAKARVFLAGRPDPMLVLYHHDEDGQRTREDYYHLEDGVHKRFYTSIKLLGQGLQYMIYHKQHRSPRACFITPLAGAVVELDAVRRAEFMGRAVIERHVPRYPEHFEHFAAPPAAPGASASSSSSSSASAASSAGGSGSGEVPPVGRESELKLSNVTCLHFMGRIDNGETEVDFCLDPETHVPYVFESTLFKVDVLHFDASAQSPSVFDPQRASEAECGVIGSKAQARKHASTQRPV